METPLILMYVVGVVVAILVTALVSYTVNIYILHRRYDHLPGPKRASFFTGHVPQISKRLAEGGEMIDLLLQWAIEYDRLFVMWIFARPSVIVSHPDALKDILIKHNLPKPVSFYHDMSYLMGVRFMRNGLVSLVDQNEWHRKRTATNPAFYRSHLKTLVTTYNNSCELFLEKMDRFADGKTEVSMADEFSRVTLDVIAKVAFDMDLNTIENEHTPFPSAVAKTLEGLMFRFRNPMYKFMPSTYKFQKEVAVGLKLLRETGKKSIEVRRAAIARGEEMPNDILSTMMKLTDYKGYSTEDLLDDFVTFFIAGQETTANQLAFLLMELTRHPEILHKLLDEVKEVLGSRDYVEYDDLAKLQYMAQVLKETLRLYPPAPGIIRETLQQITLNGHVIPANSRISVSIFSTHRHPANWEDPDVFVPDRWGPENAQNIKGYAYLPFSAGPRNCIGQVFAQFESKVLLARFLQKFQFTLCEGQTFQIMQRATLRPKDGVVCFINRRHEQ